MAMTTDVTPRILLTPSQVLQHPQKLGRLKSTLLEGIFSYDAVDETGANDTIDECLKICGGSTETLSELLQTTFITDHTPFYWLILNLDPKLSETSLLLTKLLDICKGQDLSAHAQEDILDAFFAEYDSNVYHVVQPYIPFAPQHAVCSEAPFSSRTQDRPRVTVSSYRLDGVVKATIEFSIPRFFSRILADGEVYFEFLVLGRAWGLRARVQPEGSCRIDSLNEYNSRSWAFELSEVWKLNQGDELDYWISSLEIDDSVPRRPGLTLPLVVHRGDHHDSKVLTDGTPFTITIPARGGPLRTFRRNTYTSNPIGELCGKVFVES